MSQIYKLKGAVKHYDWGGYSFIPALLKMENKENKPFAEYWLGTHALGIGEIELADGTKQKLTDKATNLSYLLKVLDVKDMLSIQVHPSKEAAVIEFERENKEGVALDSPKRNYKDDNHKPEMLVALSDFYLLHGFKTEEKLNKILTAVPELNFLLPVFKNSGYKGLYKEVMTMPQSQVNAALQPLLDRIVPLYKENKIPKTNEDFWAARASITFSKGNDIDRGIFSIYLFNVIYLKKGEALFQGAGLPHAYLKGQNVELMSNSDNVLRGGLTSKHVDVDELLKHVKCEPTVANILTGHYLNKNKKVFTTPVPDFQLSIFELKAGESVSFTPIAVEILLLTDGKVSLSNDVDKVNLETGAPSALVLPGGDITLTTSSKAVVFRASLPVNDSE